MELILYLLVIFLAFVTLLVSLAIVKKEDEQRIGAFNFLAALSMILFIVAAFSSVYITQEYCFLQVDSADYAGNTTTYDYSFLCETRHFEDIGLAWLFGILAFIVGVLMIVYTLIFAVGKVK